VGSGLAREGIPTGNLTPGLPVGESLLAKFVNDNAGRLTPV